MEQLTLNWEDLKKTLTIFIRERFSEAGISTGIVGLSGGVDSAVVCALAAEALGQENVLGVRMPYRTSSPDSLNDALAVGKKIGVHMETVELTPLAAPIIRECGTIDKVRIGNILARVRMIILYDRSARDRGFVLGTSNKSEMLLGYGTIYGDLASAINPIGDLYKTQVWQLARVLGIPDRIIKKNPTADLWKGQTDEGELGISYIEADKILYWIIEEGKNDDELKKMGYDMNKVDKIRYLIKSSGFKRRMPLIAKVPELARIHG